MSEGENFDFEEFLVNFPNKEGQFSLDKSESLNLTLQIPKPSDQSRKRPHGSDEITPETQKSFRNRARNKQYRERVKEEKKNSDEKILELKAQLKEQELQIEQFKQAKNEPLKKRANVTTVTIKCPCTRKSFDLPSLSARQVKKCILLLHSYCKKVIFSNITRRRYSDNYHPIG